MHITKHEKNIYLRIYHPKKDVQLSIKNYEADEKARKNLQKRHKEIINAKLSYDTNVGTIRQGILNYCD